MEELRDANGMTEAEFIAAYDPSKYERPSVTVDIIIIAQGRVLLIKRGGHPNLGKLAFPGGFVEMNEDVYTAASRELMEETGLAATNLRQLPVFSRPDRDPRTRIITVPFLAEVKNAPDLQAGDDAMAANWYDISQKSAVIGDTVIYEITLSNKTEKHSFKVSKGTDKKRLSADPVYKSVGSSPLAGDHGEILALALDMMKE